MAISGELQDMFGAQISASASTVVNQKGTSRLFGQLIGQGTGVSIYGATSRSADHQGNRFAWPNSRLRRQRRGSDTRSHSQNSRKNSKNIFIRVA
jgi:hypothetical protein